MGNANAAKLSDQTPAITHFSHTHPLQLIDSKTLPHFSNCSACKLDATTAGSVYTCKSCNFILHQKCVRGGGGGAGIAALGALGVGGGIVALGALPAVLDDGGGGGGEETDGRGLAAEAGLGALNIIGGLIDCLSQCNSCTM